MPLPKVGGELFFDRFDAFLSVEPMGNSEVFGDSRTFSSFIERPDSSFFPNVSLVKPGERDDSRLIFRNRTSILFHFQTRVLGDCTASCACCGILVDP